MIDLSRHGVLPVSAVSTDVIHENSVVDCDADEFFERARRALAALTPEVAKLASDILAEVEGRWHPSGFVVFPLGAHPSLGSLRLHVWPAGVRRRVPQGDGNLGAVWDGDVHNHAWNIASSVLRTYRDEMWSVSERLQEQPAVASAGEVFRPYTVSYVPGARQDLVTDGSWVRASVNSTRTVLEGDTHTIRYGDFHAPSIPDDVLGSTLVFSSPRVLSAGPDVLIRGPFRPVTGARRIVSAEDRAIIRAQLRSVILRRP